MEDTATEGGVAENPVADDIAVIPDPTAPGQVSTETGRPWWDPAEHADLSLVQKILLATDGTVTRILEACSGEPMHLVKLNQAVVPWASADPALGVSEGDEVISRRILLEGEESGRTYLYAESLIVPERLHPRLRHGLFHSDAPIGWLLWHNRIETVRELLRWGVGPADSCAQYFEIDPGEPVVSRTYRVISQRQPIMLITEKFPASSFPD